MTAYANALTRYAILCIEPMARSGLNRVARSDRGAGLGCDSITLCLCYGAVMATVRPLDTSADADRAQFEVYRRMTGAQRLKVALDMSEFVRECAKSRIRKRQPEMTEEQVTRELIREMYGV